MTDEQLQQWMERVSEVFFGHPFVHQARFNKRLQTTGGRYLLATHAIEMNHKYLDAYGEEYFEKIMKHELCHYHLHLQGKGYQHRDVDFKTMLRAVGGTRFCKRIETVNDHQYECQTCHFIYHRKKQLNVVKYVCGKCKGRLKKITDK
ncbi:SprT family protein [Brochothrix thermosphacta]|uniref:SprT family protein n=1 Tax=Brochothrix thermosphacta TaxID=2756 RepID=UPI000EC2DE35|nr:SprT family protein [Brochothrix thermosphacta]HCZ39941.1 SprT family protein [Brochothrix thermosphacta]HCZ47142.1 SprT family protein [Brochothrix thermosphacta]